MSSESPTTSDEEIRGDSLSPSVLGSDCSHASSEASGSYRSDASDEIDPNEPDDDGEDLSDEKLYSMPSIPVDGGEENEEEMGDDEGDEIQDDDQEDDRRCTRGGRQDELRP
jgi:hypothetical protein